ncbi:MAG TPA: hypothetical protein V6C57_20570 [Coleofasciculaceae cyanobacterium]
MKRNSKFGFLGTALVGLMMLSATPAFAQEIQLGNGLRVDLDRDHSQLRPSISSDGNRVNIGIYQQPEPETRVRISNDGFDVREVQPQPQQRVNLSLPLNQNQQLNRN